MFLKTASLIFTLTLFSAGAFAAHPPIIAHATMPAGKVNIEAVQAPVWLIRNGAQIPLLPGTDVLERDWLVTGEGARLHLTLPDGSTLKLGEDARFEMHSASANGDIRGELRVYKGAFQLYAAPGAGDWRVRVGPLLSRIRPGSDVWAESGEQAQIVYLLEGSAQVAGPRQAPRILTTAGTAVIAPRGKPVGGVVPISGEKSRGWFKKTQLVINQPAQKLGGDWRVVVSSLSNSENAKAYAKTLADKGYDTDVEPTKVNGKTVYRVVFTGFSIRSQAQAFADKVKTDLDLNSAWVLPPAYLSK